MADILTLSLCNCDCEPHGSQPQAQGHCPSRSGKSPVPRSLSWAAWRPTGAVGRPPGPAAGATPMASGPDFELQVEYKSCAWDRK
jgi:hypothetical protein